MQPDVPKAQKPVDSPGGKYNTPRDFSHSVVVKQGGNDENRSVDDHSEKFLKVPTTFLPVTCDEPVCSANLGGRTDPVNVPFTTKKIKHDSPSSKWSTGEVTTESGERPVVKSTQESMFGSKPYNNRQRTQHESWRVRPNFVRQWVPKAEAEAYRACMSSKVKFTRTQKRRRQRRRNQRQWEVLTTFQPTVYDEPKRIMRLGGKVDLVGLFSMKEKTKFDSPSSVKSTCEPGKRPMVKGTEEMLLGSKPSESRQWTTHESWRVRPKFVRRWIPLAEAEAYRAHMASKEKLTRTQKRRRQRQRNQQQWDSCRGDSQRQREPMKQKIQWITMWVPKMKSTTFEVAKQSAPKVSQKYKVTTCGTLEPKNKLTRTQKRRLYRKKAAGKAMGISHPKSSVLANRVRRVWVPKQKPMDFKNEVYEESQAQEPRSDDMSRSPNVQGEEALIVRPGLKYLLQMNFKNDVYKESQAQKPRSDGISRSPNVPGEETLIVRRRLGYLH